MTNSRRREDYIANIEKLSLIAGTNHWKKEKKNNKHKHKQKQHIKKKKTSKKMTHVL